MFSRRNKKIFTAAVMVIVAIGLIGPGALLLFAPTEQSLPVQIVDESQITEINSREAATSSPAATE